MGHDLKAGSRAGVGSVDERVSQRERQRGREEKEEKEGERSAWS